MEIFCRSDFNAADLICEKKGRSCVCACSLRKRSRALLSIAISLVGYCDIRCQRHVIERDAMTASPLKCTQQLPLRLGMVVGRRYL